MQVITLIVLRSSRPRLRSERVRRSTCHQQALIHQRLEQLLHPLKRVAGRHKIGQRNAAAGVGSALAGLNQPRQDVAQFVTLLGCVTVGQDFVGLDCQRTLDAA